MLKIRPARVTGRGTDWTKETIREPTPGRIIRLVRFTEDMIYVAEVGVMDLPPWMEGAIKLKFEEFTVSNPKFLRTKPDDCLASRKLTSIDHRRPTLSMIALAEELWRVEKNARSS